MDEFASRGRPHDRLARSYFGNETAIRQFLEDFLPPEMSAALDYASLESRKESYISENLRESITDLVFECRLHSGDPGSVYLLFEAKHNPEHLCALQVLRYMLALWEEAVAGNSSLRKLPFVLPIVFYHGKRTWNGRQMRELFAEGTPFSVCIPDFSMQIFNLADVPEEKLKSDFVRNAMLLLLKAVNDALPARKIAEAFRLLESALDDDIMRTLRLFINYLEQSRPDITPDALLKEMERLPQGETTMQTFMERFSELAYQRGMLVGEARGETQGLTEGKAQGLAEGKAQGLAEGKAQGLAEGKAQGLAEGKAQGLAEGKAQGLAEGKAQGLAEGKARGLEEGKTRGEMKALRETLLDLLADRFGPPPVGMIAELERMESSLVLRSLIRAIPAAESLEAFQALLGHATRKQ